MRTTIDITDKQRAALLSMAAVRGEKGFSALLREAIDQYLADKERRAERLQAALEMKGALDDREAAELAAGCAAVRSEWR